MKYLFIWVLLTLPQVGIAQNGSGKCPNGWEKHPDKYPECSGMISLPVTVTSFEAQVVGQTVVLKWETALEVNHSHYEIQRSADGRSFTTIGSTTGHQFKDYQPAEKNYYRLVSVDIDQTRHAYNVVYAGLQPRSYTIYTAQGKLLGQFKSLDDAPRNTILIINQTKQIIR